MARNTILLILIKLLTTFVENYNQMNKEEINKMLFDACSNLNISNIQNAIESGADVNAIIDKNTAFYQTIFCNRQPEQEEQVIDILDILLENGADINLNVEEGASTAIFYAAYNSKSKTLTKYLLDKGANINKVSIGEEWTIINYINNDLQSRFCEERTKAELKEMYDFLITQGAKDFTELEGKNINTLNTEKKSKEHINELPKEQQKDIPHTEPNKKVINIAK
jgi:ankyrin repeat protein